MNDWWNKVAFSIGIIGCGSITRNIHLPVLMTMPLVQVRWLYDQDFRRMAALADMSGVPKLSSSDQLAVATQSVDGILLALPNGARPPYIQFVGESGAAMAYVEKPFARALAEHIGLSSGLEPWRIAVGHTYRSAATVRLLKHISQQKLFGNLREMSFEFGGLGRILTGGGYLGDAHLSGGGAMYQMGSHYLDALLYISNATDEALGNGRMEQEVGIDIHTEAELLVACSNGPRVPLRLLVTALRPTKNIAKLVYDHATISTSLGNSASPLQIASVSGDAVGEMCPNASHGPNTVAATFAWHWQRAILAATSMQANETSVESFWITSKALDQIYRLARP